MEGSQNNLLTGTPGHVVAEEDIAGRQIADSVQIAEQPVNGADLKMTIDSGVQHILEAQLYDAYTRNHAHGATGIVMDVHTGAILAMATFPTYDANRYSSVNPTLYDNPAVARPYEPGSVMKAFTIASALDAGAITTSTKVVDGNNLTIAGVRIQNADRFDHPWGHGPITAQQVLQLSNNNGAAKIGLKLGGERLYQAFRRFGFGQPTGIDIAGEVAGTVWDPSSPNASGNLTTAQNAFGQGLTVTAVQLVAGYAAIANGGTMVTPHVVAGWTDASGTYHAIPIQKGERVMRPETSATVMKLSAIHCGCRKTLDCRQDRHRGDRRPGEGSRRERQGRDAQSVHPRLDRFVVHRGLPCQPAPAGHPDPASSPGDVGSLLDGPAAGDRVPPARAPDSRLPGDSA